MKLSRIVLVMAVIFVAVAVWAISVYGPKRDLGKQSNKTTESVDQKETDDKQATDDKQGESVKTEDESDSESGEKPATDNPEGRPEGEQGGMPGGRMDRGRGDRREGGPGDAYRDEDERYDDPNELVAINLNNVDMKSIIQTLGDWTRMPIIPTDDKIMAIKITIYANEKVPRYEALSLIQDALRAKGYILEYAADKIYLKPLATAKFGSVPTVGPDEPLARIQDKSQIVEKFFKVHNYSPTKLATVITPLIAEYGHVTAVEDAGTISVIDTVENLIRIKRVIDQFDVPESEQTVEKVFEIANADVLEVVQLLQMILDKGKGGKSIPYRPAPAGKGQAQPATSIVIASGQIPLKLIPMPKQKWIIATGSPDDLERIGEWIDKLDVVESVVQEQTIVQVEYAEVREVVNIIERMIEDMPGQELRKNLIVEELGTSRQIVIIGSDENRKMVERMINEIDMPVGDLFVQETFILEHADPDQIKENIDGLFEDATSSYNPYSYSSRSRYGSSSSSQKNTVKVISYPTMSRVTVKASKENMEEIRIQIAEWDVPLDIEKDQYRILTLKNSDPVKLSELLTKLFSEDDSGSSSNIMSMIFGRRGGSSEEKKKIVGSLYGMLTFEPVPDTKKIIVISKISAAYEVIAKLVSELDSQEIAEVPQVVVLKYADAEDLCDQLNAILNEPGTRATLKRRAQGLSAYQSLTSDGSTTSGDEEATDPGELTPWWSGGTRSRDDEMPTSNLIGQIRFIPVHRSKAILVLAPPEYLPAIKDMIGLLDQPGKQVMIKAVIVEVDRTKMTSLGLKLTTEPKEFGNLGTNTLSALANLASSATYGSVAASYAMNVNAVLDVLAKNTDAKILNQPTLCTKDNEEALFFKGQNIPFNTGSLTDRSNPDSVTSTSDYRDVGVTLRVRPNITPENAVDITLNLEISQPEGEDVTNKLNTTTQLIVDDGETIMLGGILYQTESDIRSKVPLLGDIPLIGMAFQHEDTIKSNRELIIFLTPYVLDGPETKPETMEQIEAPKMKMKAVTEHLDELFKTSDSGKK